MIGWTTIGHKWQDALDMRDLLIWASLTGLLAVLPAIGSAADERDDFLTGATKACVACELAGRDLAGRDFKRAKLDRANLRGVNLSNSTLFRASLVRADLSAANLAGSNLNLVDAKWADLGGANLAGALLYEADLSTANLAKAAIRYAHACERLDINLNGSDIRRVMRGFRRDLADKGRRINKAEPFTVAMWERMRDIIHLLELNPGVVSKQELRQLCTRYASAESIRQFEVLHFL